MSTKKMHKMQLRIKKEIFDEFKKKCEADGRTVSEVIRGLIYHYLNSKVEISITYKENED